MNKIDLTIIEILLKICDILTKYSNNVTNVDVHSIRSLIRELGSDK